MLLKREFNINALSDSEVELELSSVACYDYYKDENKVEARIEYNTNVNLYVGEEIGVTNTIERNDEIEGTYMVPVSEKYEIAQSDSIFKTFSLIVDKYQPLILNNISLIVEDNVLYIHFVFDEWHYFRSWDTHGIEFMIDFQETTITFTGCEYISDTELRWRYDSTFNGIDDFMCVVFRNDSYRFVGLVDASGEEHEDYVLVDAIPESACFTDEMYLKIYVTPLGCKKYELYEKECNDGSVSGLNPYRLNFKFKDVNLLDVYVTVPLASVNFPLSLETGNDTYQEQNIYENFVFQNVNESKNGFVEMEKLVYHPVFKLETDNENGQQYKSASKIKFNLHFRERDENGWVVKPDGMWNGILKNQYGQYVQMGDVNMPNAIKYFSYVGNIDKGSQSDLLSYLGFNDSDVKYQKSKLKKSFLRLSFYDSTNRANQNLLGYSTIFMNTGLLFTKMMTGANRKGRYVLSGETLNTKYDNAKVNTEPCFVDYTGIDVEEIENFRLSSQLVVSNRLSDLPSEGFYFYLWADNDNGAIPSDVYMRVEFNHAGYGRVIPLTMPFSDDENKKSIYTMEDICDIWTDGGWGIRTNEKYSYIHFKYVYDTISKRHVYYLDPDTYGYNLARGSDYDILELNLYEPKITI